jgi:hypothetical protein
MDQRCVLGLRQKARGSRLLGLRAGRHGQRSEDEYRRCQSHGEFSHQTLLLVVMSGKLKRQRYSTATTLNYRGSNEPTVNAAPSG